MDIWVTKYALTAGIQRRDDCRIDDNDVACNHISSSPGAWVYLGRGDYATSPEAALADAEKRRAAKIASLKKQIAKLEKLTFTAEPSA